MTTIKAADIDIQGTGPDSLNEIMEFDHVIRVNADGTVDTSVEGIYSPSLMQWEEYAHDNKFPGATVWKEELDSPDWTLLEGWTGQYSYRGPMMHASEFIGGGIARHILATPGLYVVIAPSCTDINEEDVDPESWAIAFKPLPESVQN